MDAFNSTHNFPLFTSYRIFGYTFYFPLCDKCPLFLFTSSLHTHLLLAPSSDLFSYLFHHVTILLSSLLYTILLPSSSPPLMLNFLFSLLFSFVYLPHLYSSLSPQLAQHSLFLYSLKTLIPLTLRSTFSTYCLISSSLVPDLR